ncbi:MAG: response regulator [Phycisphaerae bacterium]|nr:response regulator [Phycisphaerae bacterium]
MNSDMPGTFRIMLVGQPEIGPEFQRWLDTASVTSVNSWPDAVTSLANAPCDLIIIPRDLLPKLDNVPESKNAAPSRIPDRVAVAVAHRGGAFTQSNRAFEMLPATVREAVAKHCVQVLGGGDADSEKHATEDARQPLAVEGAGSYQLAVTRVFVDPTRPAQAVVMLAEDAADTGMQDAIHAIDRAGRELLNLDPEQVGSMSMEDRLELLEQKSLGCVRDLLHFDNFEIRVLDRSSGRLNLVLSFGVPADAASDAVAVGREGQGICGYVASTHRSYLCRDTQRDSRYRRGIDDARSSLTVPLMLQDRMVGVANFESTRVGAFNDNDRTLAEIFGRYVALALNLLDLLVTERTTMAAQIGQNLLSEVTGPLNDMLTEIENLVEDYIGHDDLRHRMRTLSENAVKVRDTLRTILSQRPHVGGVHAARPDRVDDLLAGKRILVADDEDIIRETVRDVLTGYGCEVHAAADGATAIGLLSQQSFDLVLTDVRMPRKNGYEVFAAAKEINPHLPVILTTGFGYDPNHSIVRARREGLSAVLFKPFKVDQLMEEVRAALKLPVPSN